MTKKKGIIIAAAVAVVLLAVTLILIFVPKGGQNDEKKGTIDEGVDLTVSVDKDGIHQAKVNTDEDGNIKNNSYGTLMQYYPANIKLMHIENTKGTFDVEAETPEGEATIYTIKGYEDFDLQAGNPAMIASAAASLSFTKVATLDKEKGDEEFGFDEPRSTVTVTYQDSTKAIITVGDDAPQQAGTYIRFGTGDAVYVADTEIVSAFDYGVTDLISKTINQPADSAENNELSELTLSGSGFANEIVMVPNDDGNYSESFALTAPVSRLADEKESSLLTGGIRGLFANEVKMVNPSEKQLKDLGLQPAYAQITAVYPDETIELSASKPDADGNVCLMKTGGKVVYVLPAEKAAWTLTGLGKLCGGYVLNPKLTALSGVTVQANGKSYDFSLSTEEKTSTDDKGIETTTVETKASYGGKQIEIGKFTSFYQSFALLTTADTKADSGSGKTLLKLSYSFADGNEATVEYIDAGGAAAIARVNGETAGHIAKAEITRVTDGIAAVIT